LLRREVVSLSACDYRIGDYGQVRTNSAGTFVCPAHCG
jgi:hypothetical protein